MRPWLLRPACVGSDSSSVFSGSLVVISSKPATDMNRRPGLVGLNFLIGIFLSDAPEEAFDLLAFPEGDDGLLPAGGVAERADSPKAAAGLAAHGHGIDVLDLDPLGFVLLLEGLLDLGLRGRGGDPERVPPLRVELVGALGDDRADHDLGGCAGGHSGSWPPWSCASWSSRPAFGRCGLLKFSSSSSRQSFASNR